MTALEWSWGGSPLTFLPQRALWRAEGRELFVADLHLGKAEAFQAHGIPMPSDGDQGTPVSYTHLTLPTSDLV